MRHRFFGSHESRAWVFLGVKLDLCLIARMYLAWLVCLIQVEFGLGWYALDEPGLSEMLFSWLDKKIYTQEIVFGCSYVP